MPFDAVLIVQAGLPFSIRPNLCNKAPCLDSNADNAFTVLDAAWANVEVWQDTDHDGVTDAGELKSFDELGITSINLAPTAQSGLVNGGNEVLATGTFVQNGVTKEAQAARFIANPTGNTSTVSANGTTVSAEDGQSTYVSSVTTGASPSSESRMATAMPATTRSLATSMPTGRSATRAQTPSTPVRRRLLLT